MRLNHFSIKSRIYMGFAALILLILGLAAFGIVQLSYLRSQNDTFVSVSDNSTRVLETGRILETLQRTAQHYQSSGDNGTIDEFVRARQQASDLMKTASGATISRERFEIYQHVRASLDVLGRKFQDFVQTVEATKTTRAKLDKQGKTLSATTTHLIEAADRTGSRDVQTIAERVNAASLLVRVANWRYLATRDPQGVAIFYTSMANAENAIAEFNRSTRTGELQDAVAAVSPALEAYQTYFVDISVNLRRQDEEYNVMIARPVAGMRMGLESARASLLRDLSAIQARSQDKLSETLLIGALGTASALLLGAFLAITIARSIVGPLVTMTNSMVKLAAGDMSTEVPAADGKDEIAEMARALEVFRDNRREILRLETEAETRRIVAEEERRHKLLEASYLAAIVSSSSDAIIGKNLSGVVASWNPAAERLFGYAADEMIGRHISLIIPHERLDEEDLILEQIRSGRRVEHFETMRRRKDGQEIPVSLTVSPIRDTDGKIMGASKIVRDVSERMQAAETLRLSEERFRSIFGAVAEGIFITDAETGTFTDANEPGAAMYGYTPEEMIGLTMEAISSDVSPYTQAGARAWIEKAAISGDTQQFDWHAKRKDGGLFWGEISIRLAYISGRKVVLAIVRDVTERRDMEAQLRQALKMEAIGTLAGGVAHELNNLLQPIIMMTELVMMKLPDRGSEFHQLERVVDAGAKASEIVQRILAFGRADEASHSLLDISLVVREGISFIRTIMPASVNLHVGIDESVGFIRGDKTQLTQVLINLATNARDAIGSKTGTLSVWLSKTDETFERTDPKTGVITRGPCAILALGDTGSGMDSEIARRIFEPFFTTKGVGKGTGLGLSVTHGIITGHGGTIQVDSTTGRGTRFTIYLPLEQPTLVAKRVSDLKEAS
jgi:PAS domain S-box-containing protein